MSDKGVRKWVILDKQAVKWFEENYPQHSYSWLINLVLKHFIANHSTTPPEIMKAAANSMREEMVELHEED